jgi:hypothetical protein
MIGISSFVHREWRTMIDDQCLFIKKRQACCGSLHGLVGRRLKGRHECAFGKFLVWHCSQCYTSTGGSAAAPNGNEAEGVTARMGH